MKLTGLVGCLLCAALAGCGGGSEGGGGAGGAGTQPSGGAGGAGASAACACDPGTDNVQSQECFCEVLVNECRTPPSIEAVLSPTCPGSLIHPISASCAIGGVYYPADNDLMYTSYKYLFDRDSEELVGLYASTDVQIWCDGTTSTVRWGNVAASCELCDPCAPNEDYPPCPGPDE